LVEVPPISQEAVSVARRIAARVLEAVYKKGGFAAAELDRAFAQNPASVADRALATELVYGVLRTRGALEQRLKQRAPRGLAGNDQRVVLQLVMASYQLCFLTRVPSYAAISQAVTAVRELRGSKVAGFCNALLRRFDEQPKPSMSQALQDSAPVWLRDELEASVGSEQALALLGVGEVPDEARAWVPTPTLRLREGTPKPAWLEKATVGRLVPTAWKVQDAGDLLRRSEYVRGEYVVQDEGSMFAALALGAKTGDRVLDCCAGRGQKTSLLAERVGQAGTLWATDVAAKKLEALEREFVRLGIARPKTRVVDWRSDDADVPRDFDRVLVDAPCSGSGTLRRRPEIALRLTPRDIPRLAELAESILRNAARHVRPEGRVVFVVCSVLQREGEGVIERVADVLRPTPFDLVHPLVERETSHIRLLPGVHGTDGFFIASLAPVRA
jgi:16S rRNA (cytosine967-C5)-methyltransferase